MRLTLCPWYAAFTLSPPDQNVAAMIIRWRGRRLLLLVMAVVVGVATLAVVVRTWHGVRMWVSHLVQPFRRDTRVRIAPTARRYVNLGWDADEPGRAEGTDAAALCAAYGLPLRPAPLRVYDAVLFAYEWDMLELRLHELASQVEAFVVVEGDATFTGRRKPRALHAVVADLAAGGNGSTHAGGRDMTWLLPLLPRLRLVPVTVSVGPHVSAWQNEDLHRDAFAEGVAAAGARAGDLAIVADLDEVPRAAAVRVLRTCAVPDASFPVRLQMRFYYYSFEWRVPGDGWLIATVNLIGADTARLWFTRASRSEDTVFFDAGWHCSWCLAHVADLQYKMGAYAHTDHAQAQYLDPVRIQARLCAGRDLFDRLPEAHSVAELLQQWDGANIQETSLVGAPAYLVRHGHTRFPYLLPGHCRRADAPALPAS
jgi:beta-1,4-mannosyl-glycoprotein beta-1,4-N-acetylglucosaminyltransferase